MSNIGARIAGSLVLKTIGRWLAAVLVFAAGCSSGEETLKVQLGVVQSLTGAGAAYGQSGAEGIRLAVDEVNASDGGIRIEYSVSNDESKPDTGVEAFRTFVANGVTAVIGPSLSNVAFQALAVTNDAGIPAISPMTSASGIGNIGDYVFRVALAEDASLPALIARVGTIGSVREGVLFFDSRDAYSRSSAEAMRAGLAASGGAVTLEVDITAGMPTAATLTGPAVAGADVFLLPVLFEAAAPVLRGLRDAGLMQPAVGGSALASPDLAKLAGGAANGTYVASTWHPDVANERSQEFVRAYTEEFGHPPDNYAAVSYASVYLLVDALKRAGSTDPDRLRDALAATSGLDSVLGTLSIKPSGDATFPPVFQMFSNGKLMLDRPQ
ncbi:MAG: ABC transporter substrate-binding protein [Dehalococcoidia bacterium]